MRLQMTTSYALISFDAIPQILSYQENCLWSFAREAKFSGPLYSIEGKYKLNAEHRIHVIMEVESIHRTARAYILLTPESEQIRERVEKSLVGRFKIIHLQPR